MTEFDDVIQLLRERRPAATELELDEIKRRARSRAARASRRRQPMKSRLAIIATLALGMVLSTAGVGLGISGLGGTENAGVAQYGTATPTPTQHGTSGVLPEQESQAGTTTGGGEQPGQGAVAGEQQSGGSSPQAVQPTRQVEAGATGGGGKLPFSGFAAIPVLIAGIALLAVGLVLRRRATA